MIYVKRDFDRVGGPEIWGERGGGKLSDLVLFFFSPAAKEDWLGGLTE